MNRNPEYECVEIFPDGSELVRHTGSYAVCVEVYTALRAAEFRAEIRIEGTTERRATTTVKATAKTTV